MSKPAAARARQSGRSWLWLQGAAGGVVAATLPGAALLTATLLCPAIAMALTEKTAGRPVTRTMVLFGSAATFMPLRTLWNGGNTLSAAADILSDPSRPLLAWIACAAGWLLCEAMQVATRITLAAQSQHRIATLQAEQTALQEEWQTDDGPTS